MAATAAVDRLRLGDHVCWGFDDDGARLDAVARFVAAGVREHHRILYLTETELPAALREALAARGIPVDELLAVGQLEPAARVAALADYVAAAERTGYAGVRVVADMTGAVGPAGEVERVVWFEAHVNPVFTGGRVMAICLYDCRVFSAAQLSRLGPAHPATARPQDAAATWSPLLRAYRIPGGPGLRLVGAMVAASRAVPAGLRLTGCRPELARLLVLVGGRHATQMLGES